MLQDITMLQDILNFSRARNAESAMHSYSRAIGICLAESAVFALSKKNKKAAVHFDKADIHKYKAWLVASGMNAYSENYKQ